MSSKDFKSFIITNPDLVDEGIDISGLRTTTDTRQELLSDVPEFSGIEYDPTQKNYVSDLYALYSGQLPSTPAPAVTASNINIPLPGGGESGGGGQTIDTAYVSPNLSNFADNTADNTFIGGGATLEDAGGTAPGGLYATDYQGEGVGNLADYPVNTSYGTNPATGQPYQTPRTIADQNAVLGQTFNGQQDPSFWEKAKNNFIQTGEDIGGFFANLGKQGLDIGNLTGTTILNLAGKALTNVPLLGTAASLIGGALPPRDPRQNALDEFYTTGAGAQYLDPSSPDYIPGMENYNPVSGNPLNPTFGLQDAYQDRIDTIENTLANTYNMTAAEIADVKAGSYTGDVDSDLLDRLNQLEDVKTKEKARLDLFSGDVDERDQMLDDISFDTTPTNLTADITSDQIDEFSTDPVTGVTRPGTVKQVGTVLGKKGINRFDDAETDVNLSMPEGASKTGTPIDSLNPINRQQHFDNTEKLKDAVRAGKITPEEYNRLSAFDATKTMGLGPVTGTGATIGYQGIQTAAGDQGIGDFLGDTARNIQGVSGNLTPEEQVQYQEIISGEDIYRDPILGMVEPPAPMTLADDTINRMTNDVDLDLFDNTAYVSPTFDADTFDDDASFIGPQFDNTAYVSPTFDADTFDDDASFIGTPTGTNRPGGDSRDDGPAPSAPADDYDFSDFDQGDDSRADPTGTGNFSDTVTGNDTSPGATGGEGGGGGGGGGGKIVCTMMNNSYGFGSFRNKIWLKHSKNMAPEYQIGYHKIFLPLIKIAKTNKVVKKVLEHIAIHRTIDIRQESRGKTHLLGRVYRKILEPICYLVGKYAK